MSERARLIGATLQIDSTPGSETMVSIHLPLDGGPNNDQYFYS
ncbi:hypothetical protein [Caballeronia mineralivorans]|jgi:signal transduction histidine kinase|nr:hypothetical protein [Caballeronia mineralivorans]